MLWDVNVLSWLFGRVESVRAPETGEVVRYRPERRRQHARACPWLDLVWFDFQFFFEYL